MSVCTLCMHVCVCVYINVYIYIYIYIYVYICTYVRMWVCMYARMYSNVMCLICLIYVCMHASTHVCTTITKSCCPRTKNPATWISGPATGIATARRAMIRAMISLAEHNLEVALSPRGVP